MKSRRIIGSLPRPRPRPKASEVYRGHLGIAASRLGAPGVAFGSKPEVSRSHSSPCRRGKHQQRARESENLGGRQASRPAKSLETFALTMRRRGPAQTRISAGLFLAVSVTSRACQRRLIPRVFQLLQLTLARLRRSVATGRLVRLSCAAMHRSDSTIFRFRLVMVFCVWPLELAVRPIINRAVSKALTASRFFLS